jgi:hypothetical protein
MRSFIFIHTLLRVSKTSELVQFYRLTFHFHCVLCEILKLTQRKG